MKYGFLISITFVLNAVSSVANKVMSERQDEVALYMLLLYTAATTGAFFTMKFQKGRAEKPGVLIGVLAGCCIIINTLCTIKAAALLPGVVVFPVISGLSLFLVALLGRVLFKEHIGAYGYLGIGCGILAVTLLSS